MGKPGLSTEEGLDNSHGYSSFFSSFMGLRGLCFWKCKENLTSTGTTSPIVIRDTTVMKKAVNPVARCSGENWKAKKRNNAPTKAAVNPEKTSLEKLRERLFSAPAM